MKRLTSAYRRTVLIIGHITTFAISAGVGYFVIRGIANGPQTGWFPYREVAAILAGLTSCYIFAHMKPEY